MVLHKARSDLLDGHHHVKRVNAKCAVKSAPYVIKCHHCINKYLIYRLSGAFGK